MELYQLVTDLVGRGLTYRQVQNAVFNQEQLCLSKGAISEWNRGIHNPSGSINMFRQVPSPELAYVIGVVLGDGNLNVHGYNAEILLSVTDYDFAREFSKCLAKILSREKPYKVRRSDKRNRWIVQGSSILLHKFLKMPWQELKPWIEHCEKCTVAFLRAFYDGEGSISGTSLTIYNTKKQLLAYAQHLLRKLRVETAPLYLTTLAGTKLIDPKTERTYFRKKDCFAFAVRTRSFTKFKKYVGFTIERKQTALHEACIEIRQKLQCA